MSLGAWTQGAVTKDGGQTRHNIVMNDDEDTCELCMVVSGVGLPSWSRKKSEFGESEGRCYDMLICTAEASKEL